jgi:hypothetical protein
MGILTYALVWLALSTSIALILGRWLRERTPLVERVPVSPAGEPPDVLEEVDSRTVEDAQPFSEIKAASRSGSGCAFKSTRSA